ncbi:hypothetical protein KAH43_08595 [Candidatus Bipolaricaulota bacterium]|nr:hypothetical protein [Candidatus Bipolaricaulota bacterium]
MFLAGMLGSVIILLGLVGVIAFAQDDGDTVLNDIRAEIISVEGAETAYGIPLSLKSLPEFVG